MLSKKVSTALMIVLMYGTSSIAQTTETICASGCDRATITLFESNLGSGAMIGELQNEAYETDESITWLDADPSSVTLTAQSDQRGDGTAGSGPRVVFSTSGTWDVQTGSSQVFTFEWFEMDAASQQVQAIKHESATFTNVSVVRHLMIHDQSGGDALYGFIRCAARDMLIHNSIFYNNTRATSLDVYGLNLDADRAEGGAFNNIVYGVNNTSSGDAIGIEAVSNSANHDNKNNISVNTTSSTGSALDFRYGGTNMTTSNNLSEDLTADDEDAGGNHVTGANVSTLFVSTTGGSEDFHIQDADAASVDAGFDLGTTPTDVEIDIDGRDRDSEGDVWDIGADEFVAAAGGGGGKKGKLIMIGSQ